MVFSFFSRGKLSAVSSKISSAITQIFTHKKLDAATLEELEEILIINDIGSEVSREIIGNLKAAHFEKNIDEIEIKKFLSAEIEKILKPCERALNLAASPKPQVIIFNGVNGAGKTTTIGKIAANLKKQNQKVLIAACDTFRAAASQQLEIWAQRVGCEIILPQKENDDPAAVAYRALNFAKKNNFDALLIDTAGRLQNKQDLMEELKKINAVLKKIDASAPHENLLILDATTGQNARIQMEVFDKMVKISGIVLTKLDGTARGGILVALAQKFGKAIYAIGAGERIEDLQEFNAKDFAKNLVGL